MSSLKVKSAAAWRRVLATAVDYVSVAPWLAVLGAAALGLRAAGFEMNVPSTDAGRLGAQLLIFSVLTMPLTLWLCWSDGRRGCTPGKLLMGLRVESEKGGFLTFGDSLKRSALKVAVPWELAHAGIWQSIGQELTTVDLTLFGLSYLFVGANMVLLFYGGRPIYDRLAHAIVRRAPGLRRLGHQLP
jgi:uncharacterized RDD family membrane protein YckC